MSSENWHPTGSDAEQQSRTEEKPKQGEPGPLSAESEPREWVDRARQREEGFRKRVDQWTTQRIRSYDMDENDPKSYFEFFDVWLLDGNVAKDHVGVPGLWDDDAKLLSFASELASLAPESTAGLGPEEAMALAVDKYQDLVEDYLSAIEEGAPHCETFLAIMGFDGFLRRYRPRG